MSETQILDSNILLTTKLVSLTREAYLEVRAENNELSYVLNLPFRTSPAAPAQRIKLNDQQLANLLTLERRRTDV